MSRVIKTSEGIMAVNADEIDEPHQNRLVGLVVQLSEQPCSSQSRLENSGQTGDGNRIDAIGIRFDWGFRIPGIAFRGETDVRFDGVIPGNFFTRIGTQSTEDRGHRAVSSVIRFVVLGSLSDRRKQVIVLDLIGVFLSFAVIPVAVGRLDAPPWV